MASYRDSINRSKTKKDKDLISLQGSLEKKASTKKATIDQSIKSIEKAGSIDKSVVDEL